MARVDWSDAQVFALKPGIYLARVESAEEKTSQKGDAYFDVALVASEWGDAAICNDVLMLEGKGRGIGIGKLGALGIPRGKDEVLASELVGRSVYVAMDIKSKPYKGKVYERPEVDIEQGASFGYWPVATPPPFDHVRRPDVPIAAPPPKPAAGAESAAGDDIPF